MNEKINKLPTLSPIEKDALKEILFIGAGNCATVLSQLVNKKILIQTPWVEVLPISEIPKLFPEQEFSAGLYSRILGDISAGLLLFISIDSAKNICKMMSKKIDKYEIDIFSYLGKSTLLEFGNILFAGFVNILARFRNENLFFTVPKITFDMSLAVLDVVLIELAIQTDYAVVMEVLLTDEENTTQCKFFILPGPTAIETLIYGVEKFLKEKLK